jgi:medium-chain acyl-[acyl-carrier-protein] hydrolase
MEPTINDELTLYSPFRVTSADTDMEARLRPGALLNMLIQSAIQSADALGFGFEGLRHEQLFWVLSRMTIEIDRVMYWNEEVEVETWPKDIDGLVYVRDYIVRNKKKKVIARATSGWLAIDIELKRPKNIEGIKAAILNSLHAKHALEYSPEKLRGVAEGEQFEVKSSYFDIDLNKHVTSTRYVDWMFDTLDFEFLRQNYPKGLSINYMKETMPSESIQIRSMKDEHSQIHFEGTNKNKGTTAFRGKLEY